MPGEGDQQFLIEDAMAIFDGLVTNGTGCDGFGGVIETALAEGVEVAADEVGLVVFRVVLEFAGGALVESSIVGNSQLYFGHVCNSL